MFACCFKSGSRQLARLPAQSSTRSFYTARVLFQNNNNSSTSSNGSLFSEITKPSTEKGLLDTLTQRAPPSPQANNSNAEKGSVEAAIADAEAKPSSIDYSSIDFSNDPEVLAFNHPAPKKAPELILSPLKARLYAASLKQYGSYPGPSAAISLEENGTTKTYNLTLTQRELEYLDPSVYITSTRIKGSYKKGTVFTRLLRQMDLTQAITQCHFSPKRIARDVGAMLTSAMDHARKLDLDPSQLYIDQIWVGKDGQMMKELDFKGRGRTGMIEYPYIHVKAILKTKESREARLEAKKEKIANREVFQQIHNSPIRVYRGQNKYQW